MSVRNTVKSIQDVMRQDTGVAGLQWRMWAANPEGITGEALLAFVNNDLFPKLKALQPSGPGDRRRVVRDVFEDAYNYVKSGQLMRQVINKITGIDFNNLAERQHFGELYEQILNDLQSAGNARSTTPRGPSPRLPAGRFVDIDQFAAWVASILRRPRRHTPPTEIRPPNGAGLS